MVKKFDPSPYISKVGKTHKIKELPKFDMTPYENPFVLDDDKYRKAACEALGIPHEFEEGKIYHHLGDIDASSSPEAIRAIIYASDDKTVYTYVEYLDAIKRLGKIQGQLDSIKKHREREDERWQQYQDKMDTWAEKDPEKRGSSPTFYNKQEPDPPPERDINLLEMYHMETHTPDVEGYQNYILSTSSEIYQAITKPVPFYLEEDPDKPHGYVLGTPGSGKSELLKLLIHTYVTNKHYGSVVVIDPSEFARQVARWEEFNNHVAIDRLIYINPVIFKGKSPCVNPFEIYGVSATDYSGPALEVKRVISQELVEALNHIVTGGGGTITGPMLGVLTNCILALLDYEGATLEDLYNFMDDKKNDALIEHAVSLKHHKYVPGYFSDKNTGFKAPGNKQTRDAIYRRLNTLLGVEVFEKLTCGKSTLHLEKEVDSRKVILFDVAKGEIGQSESSAFGRLIIAMLMGIANRRIKQVKRDRVPCAIVVDECQNFVSKTMVHLLNETRKYKMFLILAQPRAGAGMLPDIREAVLGGANLRVVGGANNFDAKRNGEIVSADAKDVLKLQTGEFLVSVHRASPPIKFKARDDLIDWKNTVTDTTWEKLVLPDQLQYYSHHLEDQEPVEKSEVEWDLD